MLICVDCLLRSFRCVRLSLSQQIDNGLMVSAPANLIHTLPLTRNIGCSQAQFSTWPKNTGNRKNYPPFRTVINSHRRSDVYWVGAFILNNIFLQLNGVCGPRKINRRASQKPLYCFISHLRHARHSFFGAWQINLIFCQWNTHAQTLSHSAMYHNMLN